MNESYIMTPNEIRKRHGLEPIKDVNYLNDNTQNNSNNCPNCGAPIKSWKCEYCDTVFDRSALEKQKELLTVKMNMLQTSNQIAALYEDAIKAIRNYRGIGL